MNPSLDRIFDEVRSAWRFRWPALGVAWLAALAGWAVVYLMPDVYEAEASVFVDTRTALKPILQGLAVEQDVNAQLNYVRQSLLAGPQLETIARDSGLLNAANADPNKRSKTLEAFRNRVDITVRSAGDSERDRDTAGSVYRITYQDRQRERSLKVVGSMLTTLVEETLGGKRQGTANAQKFLESQIKDYETRLRDAEDRLASFKKRNVGLMPAEQGGYFAQLQTEMDAVKKAESDLSLAVSKRTELNRQLRGETAITAAVGVTQTPTGAGMISGSDALSRIKEAQAKLDELLLRYTEKHPEVIATRQTLEELKRRREVEIESLRRGDPNAVASSGASSNPVYQSIQLALNQADVEIASLRGQLAMHQSKVADLRRMLDTMPQVEAEYAQLARDYDVNKAQYTQLLERLQKARLGEEADSTGSVRFEIVQPPTAAFTPVSPRRMVLMAGALALALGAGGGLAFLLHLLTPVFNSARGLAEYTGLPVLGVVSVADPGHQRAGDLKDRWGYSVCAGALLLAFVAAVALSQLGTRAAFLQWIQGSV